MSDPICAECGKPIKPHDCLQRNSRDERIAALEAENAKLRELDVVARAACIAMMEERDNYKESCSEFDRELAGVVSGLGCSVEFMDPPDGGSVTLGEQVGRMRDALTTARRECEEYDAREKLWRELVGVLDLDCSVPLMRDSTEYRKRRRRETELRRLLGIEEGT